MAADVASRLRLTVGQVALFVGWVAFAVGARDEITDNSFLWHVRAGTHQIDLGSVLTADPFSFTVAGEPWRTQSWLAELMYGWLERRWDLYFVDPMLLAIGSTMLVGLALIAFRYEPRAFAVSLYLVMAVVVSVAFFNPRPVLFGFLLMPLLMLAERDGRLAWTIPLLLWVWASVHGSFFVGALYLILRVLRRPSKKRFAVVVAAGIATLVTAHGLGALEILIRFASSGDTLAVMTEWEHPDLLSPPFVPVLLGLFLLVAAAHRGSLSGRDAWVVIPFVILMFSAGRSVPLAWIALTPYLVAGLRALPLPRGEAVAGSLVNTGLAAALVGLPLLLPRPSGVSSDQFPVDAMRYVTSERLFHDDASGGYIIFHYWPAQLVYVDDRAELFGTRINEFARVRGGSPEWADAFERDGIQEALVGPDDPLREILQLAGWSEAYRDEHFVLLRP